MVVWMVFDTLIDPNIGRLALDLQVQRDPPQKQNHESFSLNTGAKGKVDLKGTEITFTTHNQLSLK